MAETLTGMDVSAQAARARGTRVMRSSAVVAARYVVLGLGAITVLIPFLWQISTSLKDDTQINAVPGHFWPNPIVWGNYKDAYTLLPFNLFFLNTVLVEIGSLAGGLLTVTVVAYAFARLQAPFKDVLFVLVLSSLMLPFIITLVPQYFIWVKLHLVDSLWPLIIPYWFGGSTGATASFVFLLRQFFLSIPHDFAEAATLDGASILGIMFRIYVPLAKPALAAIAIFIFIGQWHDFLAPLIYLNTEKHFTLALGINQYIQQERGAVTHWGLVMAASMSIIAPPLVLFLFFQRFFIEGITLGGLKG
jgi:multiple sugar transport system permease protein